MKSIPPAYFRVGHDNKGGFAGWYLDWVSVKSNGYIYQFEANRWIDVRENDRKLEIDITPKTIAEAGALFFFTIFLFFATFYVHFFNAYAMLSGIELYYEDLCEVLAF